MATELCRNLSIDITRLPVRSLVKICLVIWLVQKLAVIQKKAEKEVVLLVVYLCDVPPSCSGLGFQISVSEAVEACIIGVFACANVYYFPCICIFAVHCMHSIFAFVKYKYFVFGRKADPPRNSSIYDEN